MMLAPQKFLGISDIAKSIIEIRALVRCDTISTYSGNAIKTKAYYKVVVYDSLVVISSLSLSLKFSLKYKYLLDQCKRL